MPISSTARPGLWQASVDVPAGRYALWLGGSFARGFVVSVDGRRTGRVEDALSDLGQFVPVRMVSLGPGGPSPDVARPAG